MRGIGSVLAVVVLAGCAGSSKLGTTSAAADVGPRGGEMTVDETVLTLPLGALSSVVHLTLDRIPMCAYPLSESAQPAADCSGDSTGFGAFGETAYFVGSPGVVSVNPIALGPDSVSFGMPASLELSTADELLTSTAVVPDPSRLDRLRIATVSNGRWQAVPGSAFDAQAQVVRGRVTAGGRYGIAQICADGTIGTCP
jgi:hypothetical protein